MKESAGKGVHAGDLGKVGASQEADAADDSVHPQHAGPIRMFGPDLPCAGFLVPRRGRDLGVELDVLTDVEGVGHPIEILFVLALWAEWIREGKVHSVGVGIGATRGVDSRTGISVFVPRSPHTGVLFEHREWYSCVPELHSGIQATHSRADDRYGKSFELRSVWLLRPGETSSPWVQCQRLQSHLKLGAPNVFRGTKAEAALQAFRWPTADVGSALVPVPLEEVGRL